MLIDVERRIWAADGSFFCEGNPGRSLRVAADGAISGATSGGLSVRPDLMYICVPGQPV